MDRSNDNEYRIALIRFEGESCQIGTYWTSKEKFALLAAALGTPTVDSVYRRSDVEANDVEGAHFYADEDEDSAS